MLQFLIMASKLFSNNQIIFQDCHFYFHPWWSTRDWIYLSAWTNKDKIYETMILKTLNMRQEMTVIDLLPHCKILKRFFSSSSSSILSLTHSNEGLFSTIQLKLVLTTSAMTFKLQNIISNYMSSTFLTQRAAVAYFLILCMLFFVIF